MEFNTKIDYPNFGFEVLHKDAGSFARLGRLQTPHGTIETPNFIFVGTKAAVRNLHPHQLREAGADIMLSNTYHLYIQPGPDLVQKMGGLHKFCGWDGPMLTDSGGFQIFSLGTGTGADEIKGKGRVGGKSLIKIDEELGAIFKSYKDGSICRLNPEISMDIQRKLGADLIVQMDECTPHSADRDYTEKSMQMSHRWGDRSLNAFNAAHDGSQGLYGVVQGGVYRELREESADYTVSRPFFGTAVGGCLGGTKVHFYEILSWLPGRLHPDRPIHLLGIGKIEDIFEGVKQGMDTFDCVTPTREARHGRVLMKGAPKGYINILNSRYKDDQSVLDETLGLYTSGYYSKSYIHHLFKVGEMLAFQIVSQHNVATLAKLMREIRAALRSGQPGALDQLKKEWLPE